MVVGEPSLMGGEFGDEDERLITRLENTQYDAHANSLDHHHGGDGGAGGPGPGGFGGATPDSPMAGGNAWDRGPPPQQQQGGPTGGPPDGQEKKSPAVSQ